jgi:hypothetical protein
MMFAVIPLSPLTIPGVVAVGPMATLRMDANLNIESKGRVLASLDLVWSNLNFCIDAIAPWNSHASRFKPDF